VAVVAACRNPWPKHKHLMSPWVRIDEKALDHPKIVAFVDYRRPLDLWVWGLSYAQRYLTDGLLPRVALPVGAEKAIKQLVTAGLWTAAGTDYQIHDYEQWNDLKATVLARREGLRARVTKHRSRTQVRNAVVTQSTNALLPRSGQVKGSDLGSDLSNTKIPEKELERKPITNLIVEQTLAQRAGDFLEKYAELYTKHRHGARMTIVRSPAEVQEALTLCATWDEFRLVKLVEIFLTTDDEWIAGTDRSFKIFAKKAGWCDDRLAQWEAKQKAK
jgi:hypothetical protein